MQGRCWGQMCLVPVWDQERWRSGQGEVWQKDIRLRHGRDWKSVERSYEIPFEMRQIPFHLLRPKARDVMIIASFARWIIFHKRTSKFKVIKMLLKCWYNYRGTRKLILLGKRRLYFLPSRKVGYSRLAATHGIFIANRCQFFADIVTSQPLVAKRWVMKSSCWLALPFPELFS